LGPRSGALFGPRAETGNKKFRKKIEERSAGPPKARGPQKRGAPKSAGPVAYAASAIWLIRHCGVIYRQHNWPERFQAYFEETIEKLSASGKTIYVMGDFNTNLLHCCQYCLEITAVRLRLRFVRFAVSVRAICGCRSCGFFTDRRKQWRRTRVPTFPDYNGYRTLSSYTIYISIFRLYL
jgi:hypothetical protein